MQINPNLQNPYQIQKSEATRANGVLNLNPKQLSNAYFTQYSQQATKLAQSEFLAQSLPFDAPQNLKQILGDIDTNLIGYKGADLASLSRDEAAKLVSDDGFFGIAKTAARIADFVISGAGDDAAKLKAGREGVLRGFAQAEKLWGGKLPQISHDTIANSLKSIDEKLAALGANALDIKA